MAGRGPSPKDAAARARTNADEHQETLLRFERGRQPPLPKGVKWHARTRAWWRMWKDSPQAEHFVASDWDFLLDTALLHSEMWQGSPQLASEVRLRVAKFGATPEDRLRLRMHFAPKVERSSQGPQSRGRTPARQRRGALIELRPAPADDDDGA